MTNIIKLQAVPVSAYTVESDGKQITMVSQALGAKVLASQSIDNCNLARLNPAFASFKDDCIKQFGNTTFTINCIVCGRKPAGFDKVKRSFSHTNIAV